MSDSPSAVSAHDVAKELKSRLPGVGAVKLHKLLYYCQGWHLALTGQPLFGEEIEAWANGPVVAEFWRDKKYQRAAPDPTDLDDKMVRTVEFVVSRYGAFSGVDLIRLTHAEKPWREVSEIAGWDTTITLEALAAYFSGITVLPAEEFEELRSWLDEPAEVLPVAARLAQSQHRVTRR
jgi:uncharacterized phage-associated protein